MERCGEKWSEAEESMLVVNYLIHKHNIFTLSKLMGRTKVAVVARLKKIGVIKYVEEARGYSEFFSAYEQSKYARMF